MGRTRLAKASIKELKQRIKISNERKAELTKYLHELWNSYQKGLVSRDFYVETAHKHFDGKTLKEWINYYEYYIRECKKCLGKHQINLVRRNLSVFFFAILIIFVVFMASIYIRPELTGFLVQEAPEVITDANATITTIQHQAILGQPVKWTKTISLDKPTKAILNLPQEARNIEIKELNKSFSEEINQEALLKEDSSPSQEEPLTSEAEETSFSITGGFIGVEGELRILKFLRNIARLTGRAVQEPSQEIELNDTVTEYEIKYETPAPYAVEEDIERGKRIQIIGPKTVHYENVLAFTKLSKEVSKNFIKLYRTSDGIREPVQITSYIDENNNDLIDKIEWVIPYLSTQTYELVIEISKAEHLDSNREFISDIYEEVKDLDDVWSETIPDTHYIRVTFEIPLDSSRDITIYPRVISGTPRIEVYEVGGNELIAEFTSINSNGYNKVLLTNLQGSQDTFDLKIIGGSVEIDYIVDPEEEPEHYPHLIGTFCDSVYDSVNKIMTDTSCLQFKTETNGVITINNERYLAFALKGMVGETEYTYTSMDFGWTWHMNESGGDYIFWAENDNLNFIWRQYYYFYKDPSRPMKIKHYLENTLVDITNTQMYYLTNVLPTDTIEYNETSYLVSDYMGLHKQGDFNDLISIINFNAEYDFRFEDLVDNGFDINEFYIGSGSVVGKPSINITAIGFTKGNGNFPKGTNVTIDPTFSTNDIEGIAIAPLDENKIVVGACDETSNNVESYIYYTNGTSIANTTIDAIGLCDLDDNVVAITPLNTSWWVIAYFDDGVDDIFFAVYDSLGIQVTAPQAVDGDSDVGTDGRVDVDAINDTSFWLAYFDDDLNDIFYAKYHYNGTALISPTVVTGQTNEGDADNIAIATLNSTHAVIVWNDDVDNDISFAIPGITNEVDVEAITNSQQVSAAAFNETAWVIGYYQQGEDDMVYSTYSFPDTNISGIKDQDTYAVGSSSSYVSEDIAIINSTHFAQTWFAFEGDCASLEFDSFGGVDHGSEILVESNVVVKGSGVASETYSSGVGLCGDNLAVAYIKATNDARWETYKPNGDVWDGECGVEWNQTSLDMDSSANNITSIVEISSMGIHTDAKVDCTGNCTEITTNWTIRSMTDKQVDQVLITCSNATAGVFQAIFNVTSDEDSSSNLLTVDCDIFTYGWLNVSISKPDDNSEWYQNDANLTVNATVTCEGGLSAKCGIVKALARYNLTASPDTAINTTEGALPFYVIIIGRNVNISTQDYNPGGLFFKSDGTKLYEVGWTGIIYQSTCSDAWNLSSCTYDNVNISSQVSVEYGLFFKSDGTKLYEGGTTSEFYQSTCSDAWNLSSCTYDNVSISSQSVPWGFFFKSDGTKMYENGGGLIYQYSCSDAWNLSSCTYDNVNISRQDSSSTGLFFKSDGTKLYEMGKNGEKIYQYSCSDAWNLSSCTYDNVNISTQDTSPNDLFFKPDGTKLYEVGYDTRKIYQYSCPTGWDLSSCKYIGIGNPETSSETLEQGGSWNISWTLNVTSALAESYLIDVLFNSTTYYPDITENHTEDRTVKLNPSAGDTDPPLWFDNSTNGTLAGTYIEHRVRWTDAALSGYIFEFDNGTGTFNNDSFVEMTGTNNWSNVSKVVNSTGSSTIRWRVYANDTASPANWNATDIFQYDTTGNNPPTHTTPGIVSTSGNNLTADNITCYNQSTSDADGDNVTNIYNWYKDNKSIMVLNMPFDTNTTSTASGAVKDYSGYSNNGTLGAGNISRVPTWNSSCIKGGCYTFDGVDDYVDLGESQWDGSWMNHTITAWIKLDRSASTYYTILAKGGGAPAGFIFNVATGPASKYTMQWMMNSVSRTSDTLVDDDLWHFVAVSIDSSNLTFYLDGNSDGVNATSYDSDNDFQLVIGKRSTPTGGQHFNGSIDEVRIYNHSLSEDQIYQLYLEGKNNYTNSTIVSGETSTGENWTCSITPNDATDDGTTRNSSTMGIVDIETPKWFDNSTNDTAAGAFIEHRVRWTDTALSGYIFSFDNGTGTLTNDSWVSMTGTNNWSNVSKIVNSTGGSTIRWQVYANDTASPSNWNSTDIFSYNTTSANQAPTHTTPGIVSTSGNNLTTDNITCYNQSTSDADGDNVTNIYNWYKDNKSIMVLNMPFDTNTTSNTTGAVKDYSGYNNNGTITDITSWNTSQDCIKGGCYEFDRTDDFINISDHASLNFTGNFTIAHWIKTDNVSYPWQSSIIKGPYDESQRAWSIYLNYDEVYISWNNGGWRSFVTTSANLEAGQWYHIAYTRNASDEIIYVNGNNTEQQSIQYSMVHSPYHIIIGGNPKWSSERLDGVIDEVKIYNISLSADQIYQLYLEGNNSYTNSTIVSGETSTGENWTCSITPNDATDDGTTRNSSTMGIVEAANTPPTIDWVQSIDATDPSDDTTKSIIFNFTATDPDGYTNINVSTAESRFQLTNEGTRSNLSCVNWSQSGNDVNFTCTIDMWYFDKADTSWIINVTIKDNSAEYAENSSTTFQYNTLMAMKMSPTSLEWSEINLTDTNTGSNNDPIVVNNTGNEESLNINITALDLQGEQYTSYYIFAANFTVENASQGCDGTTMSNATSINVTSAILYRGNHSLNYNNATSGQEELFFCLKEIPSENPAQSYSSSAFGAWEIRILLVAIIPAARRRKKKLKKRKKIAENLSIPATIFSENIGALETVTKYLRENLGMNYHEIARYLNRDERTIWTAYKKAVQKQHQMIEVKETKIFLPVSILRNRKLTVLESIIVYIKSKEMRYGEIAEIIGRDQRNIRTAYQKAVKKLKEREFKDLIKTETELIIPTTIFSRELGALEALVKYMQENLNMNYKEIASELQRDQRTIWTAYHKAIEKQPEMIEIKETNIFLPISIFKKLTILASIIIYLKEKGFKFSEIAELIERDQRNIWTIYSRAIKKITS